MTAKTARRTHTRLTFRQLIVSNNEQVVIPHADGGAVQIFEGVFLTAGASSGPEFSICYAVIEPLSSDEERDYAKRQEAHDAEHRALLQRVDDNGVDGVAAQDGVSPGRVRLQIDQAHAALGDDVG